MELVELVLRIATFACGLLFVSCLFCARDRQKSLSIHKEMPPFASDRLIFTKNVVTVIAGISYVTGAFGMFFAYRVLLIACAAGAGLFVAFYIAELVLWAKRYPKVIGGFLTFGMLGAIIGSYCVILLLRG